MKTCHLVVEIINLLPFDSLLSIFFLEYFFLIGNVYIFNILQRLDQSNVVQRPDLLRLHSQLNEDLLQFLVDEVDAELLEAVLLEDFEAVDVEDADAQHLLLGVVLHRLVHPRHQVVEEPGQKIMKNLAVFKISPEVDRLGKGVSCCFRLLHVQSHVDSFVPGDQQSTWSVTDITF